MNMCERAALVAVLTSMSMSAAQAADPITVPTTTPVEIPIHEDEGFDWSGFYAGVFGGIQPAEVSGDQYGLGVTAGVNTQFEFYLLGAEIAVQGLTGGIGDTSYGQILGRAGLVVTDDVVVYAAGGYGLDLGAPEEDDALVGGGVELAVGDGLSLRAQYLHGFPVTGENDRNQVTLGANFHF